MASVNKVFLLGNCGKDPEVRYTPSGVAICNISLATSYRRKDKSSGDSIEETEWHRVTFYDRLAEIAGEYLKKGKPVHIEGRLKYGKYTDKDGIERYTTDIIAEQMQMLGGRDDNDRGRDNDRGDGGGRQQQQRGDGRNQQRGQPQQRQSSGNGNQQRGGGNGGQRQSGSTGFDDMDDDIPF